jgi:hypothetical protein
MRSWSEFHQELQELMGEEVKVYFEAPENLKIKYPCVMISRSNALTDYADNKPYHITKRYTVTLMSKTSDNEEYLDKLLEFPMSTYDRQFVNDSIVHDVFSIYY